ncbi:MAG: tyrosine-type recombinase/integrase [Pseudomonadota bacterium]
MEYFIDQSATDPRMILIHLIITYAMFSARRQAEVCRITWQDFDDRTNRQMVRNMKNPSKKKGRDVRCEVTTEARRVLEIMPKSRSGNSEIIFPFNADTVGRRFTDACKTLGIEDLHFHNLRHEAAHRLFELGRTIPQVASITGHRSWKSLARYTHMENSEYGLDKCADWSWWERVENISKVET